MMMMEIKVRKTRINVQRISHLSIIDPGEASVVPVKQVMGTLIRVAVLVILQLPSKIALLLIRVTVIVVLQLPSKIALLLIRLHLIIKGVLTTLVVLPLPRHFHLQSLLNRMSNGTSFFINICLIVQLQRVDQVQKK
jgi:hypothetical protein